MHKTILLGTIAFLALIATNAIASYGYYYGGSYSPLHQPNSYYDLSFAYWDYDGPFVSVSFGRYTPYTYTSYYYSGCGYYWCYVPAPYYYAPYYDYYEYGYYYYTPGYYFGFNW